MTPQPERALYFVPLNPFQCVPVNMRKSRTALHTGIGHFTGFQQKKKIDGNVAMQKLARVFPPVLEVRALRQ